MIKKVHKQGGYSKTIALPLEWIKKNNIIDKVRLEVKQDCIIIRPK